MKKRIAAASLVVGLFGSLLTFASSPVRAEVGTINIPSFDIEGTTIPAWGGTYTVTWKARAGCNPALDGSVTKTFPGGVGGTLILGSFATDDNCNYSFEATYFTIEGAFLVAGDPVAAGVQCAASITVSGLDRDLTTPANAYVSVDTNDCVETADLTVAVAGPADPSDGSADNSHHRAAVKTRDWFITVTPNGKGSDGSPGTAARECGEVDGLAKDLGRDIPEIKFTLISDGLNARDGSDLSCQYEVSVTLQDGFVKFGDTSVTFTPVTGGEGFIAFNLKVAEREVYVAQTVRGDSSGGSVEYRGDLSCAETEPLNLPDVIRGRGPSSIEVVPSGRLVALEEGRYDVTGGVVGSVTVAGGRSAVVANAVGSSGAPCHFEVSVRGVPDNCVVAETRQVVDLVAAESQSLVEFFYNCLPLPPPVAIEPEVPPSSTSTTAVTTTEPPPVIEEGPTVEVPTG